MNVSETNNLLSAKHRANFAVPINVQ